jgi:hypothetical protein
MPVAPSASASLPIVVVLPVPLTPTTRITKGPSCARHLAAGLDRLEQLPSFAAGSLDSGYVGVLVDGVRAPSGPRSRVSR